MRTNNKILIVVPDATRKVHLKVVLLKLLDLLKKKVLSVKYQVSKREKIKIIVATGLHKPHTDVELKSLVGEGIFSKYSVISHDQDKNNLVKIGKTKGGIPIVLNKNLFEANYIATIGLIEPHLYAGYSGGAKTIAIGLAGEETINTTHHPRFLDKPGTAIGSIKNNPFQDCLWEIIKDLPIKYSINIVNDRKGNLKRVFKGDLKRTFNKGVKFAKKIFEKKLNKSYDAVICKVAYPKDVNLYQASRAFNYVLNTKRPVVKKDGIVLVCASLKDGFGEGIAEKRFVETLKKIRSVQEFIDGIKQKGCVAGEHRAYMVAKAMRKAQLAQLEIPSANRRSAKFLTGLGFIGPRAATYTKGLPFLSFPTLKFALKFIKHTKGKRVSIYTIPHALSIVISK